MARHDDLRFHLRGSGDRSIEVVDLKPQQHAIPVRLVARIPNPTMMVFHFEAMELKNQRVACDQSLILRAAVRALTTEQALVPAAAGFDIRYGNERLGTHKTSSRNPHWNDSKKVPMPAGHSTLNSFARLLTIRRHIQSFSSQVGERPIPSLLR
jgi:hypothetical protein